MKKGRFFKGVGIAFAIIIVALCCKDASAGGVVHPERHDSNYIEDTTISLQSQLQYYYKYVLYCIDVDQLLPIKELKSLTSQVKQLAGLKDEYLNIFQGKNMSDMYNLEKILSTAHSKYKVRSSEMMDKADIETGTDDEGNAFKGLKGSLGDIKHKYGFQSAARTVISRTSQMHDRIYNEAVKGFNGSDKTKAVELGIIDLYRTVPYLDNDTLYRQGDVGYLNIYDIRDAYAYFPFLADSSMSVPAGRVTEILDKYLDEDSPYSSSPNKKAVLDEVGKQSLELENAAKSQKSAQYVLTSLYGTIARQNEALIRETDALIESQADINRLKAINASLSAIINSKKTNENIYEYVFNKSMAGGNQ